MNSFKKGDKVIIINNPTKLTDLSIGKEFIIRSNYIDAGYSGTDYENWYCLEGTLCGIHGNNIKLVTDSKPAPKKIADEGWGF